MNKLLLIVVLLLVVAAAAWGFSKNGGDGFTTVDANEFESLIEDYNNIQLLDVRTQDEYDAGHIPGAMLIDVKDSTFLTQATSQLTKDKTVAVYCRSGRRSADAASKLVKVGYRVVNLDGGILSWQQHGKRIMQ